MQKIFSLQKEINFIFTELFIILKIEYPTDSIMNNSVRIKFNFFPVRKYFLHINLINSEIFAFFPKYFVYFTYFLAF